jgi:hypothetical protein
MMRTRCNIEDDVVAREGGSDTSNVREMSTSKHGMIGDENVAALKLAFPYRGLFAYAGGHTTKMDW